MATILNAYNLAGGDTTSSVFTGTGDCVTVEATTTNVSGNNTYLKIQSSDDQSIWKDIGQMIIGVGSDIYCQEPFKLTGIYVRVVLITNDTTTGTITVTASNGVAGTGEDEFGYTPTCVTTLGTGTLAPLEDCYGIEVASNSISFTFPFQIDLGGVETDGTYTFTLPPSFLPTNNFTGNNQLQFMIGLPNSGTWDATKYIGYHATIGAKTGTIDFHSDLGGDTIKLTAFIRYRINP